MDYQAYRREIDRRRAMLLAAEKGDQFLGRLVRTIAELEADHPPEVLQAREAFYAARESGDPDAIGRARLALQAIERG